MRTTKYCQNIGPRHLRDKKSPSKCYCSDCYDEIKNRLETIEKQGGRIQGLRAARMLAGGSFGYERTIDEKKRNLAAFFHYVMPEIPNAKAQVLINDIANNSGTVDMMAQDGIKRVKMYSPRQ